MWTIELFETQSGDCPTRNFISKLNRKTELDFVRRKIDLLRQYGNELVLMGREHAAHLTDGIFELRIQVHRKQLRILYFFFFDEKIILSHGIKKEDKVPPAEIDKARRNRDFYFKTHERQK